MLVAYLQGVNVSNFERDVTELWFPVGAVSRVWWSQTLHPDLPG